MTGPRVLLVEARFYDDIADALAEGAEDALHNAGVSFDRIQVPGALEIPPAIAIAAMSGAGYDGYVALGCVIRGETTHYETVCAESARGLMTLGVEQGLAIGNGILTVENREQALTRANKSEKNKGGGAAEATLELINLRQKFGKV